MSLPLNENDDVRAVTCSCGTFVSRFKRSSEMPSEKYSFDLSSLMFVNGSTAIVWSGAPADEGAAAAGPGPDERFLRRTPATIKPAAMAAAATVMAVRRRRGAGATACAPLVTVEPEASERAKTMSLAVWNRLPGSFSRQCRTT